jgi:TolA-binding protein
LKKNDGSALLQIADSYRASKMLTLSSEFYEKALKTPEIQSDAEKKDRIAATLGLNAYRVEDYKQANNRLEEYLKDFPSGKYREISIGVLSIGYARLGKIKNAEKYLELLKTEFPASKHIGDASKTVEAAKNKTDK